MAEQVLQASHFDWLPLGGHLNRIRTATNKTSVARVKQSCAR
jgi:hypothetical protein